MIRRLPLITLALLAVAGIVRAGTANYEQRIDAFRKEAAAQRKKLKLERDYEKLITDYPTPEVGFAAGAEPVVICPGRTATVKLTGKFMKGTLFTVESDLVTVVKEQATPTSWEATLKVNGDAAPHDVMINVMSPVSEASRVTRVLDIGCDHTWTMDLETGQRLVVKTSWPKGPHGTLEVPGDWSQGAAKLGTVKLNAHASGNYTFDRVVPQEELTAQMKGFSDMMKSPEWKALDARLTAAQKKIEPCQKVPPAQMSACMKPATDEFNAVAKERDALTKKAKGSGPKFGCDRVWVRPLPGGKLEGEGEKCTGKDENARVKVTGTITSP